ncbi:MAG: hypothetical protein IH899_13415, partial [Planctomycetes bacterium]|nr:hypothetical protein [Planctomycetota bacterium]
MEQRHYILRIILFFVLSMAILSLWTTFLAPKKGKPPDNQIAKQDKAPDKVIDQNRDLPDTDPKPESASEPSHIDQPRQPAVDGVPKEPIELAKHERNDKILLGSLHPQSGYFMQVRLTTSGAA